MKKNLILSGPTYSNGLPHLGTISNLIIKDSINRFLSLYYNEKFDLYLGFDNHGVPISNVILKKKKEINKQYDEYCNIINFRKECRQYALNESKNISNSFKNFFIKFNEKKFYYTCSLKYIKENIKVLKKIYQNNLLYKKNKPIYWCINCKTSLSLAEIEDKIREDNACFFLAKLKVNSKQNIFIIIFTTKPWTILFNQAIAFNNDLQYSILEDKKNNNLYIALDIFFEKYKNNNILQKIIKNSSIKKINILNFITKLNFINNEIKYFNFFNKKNKNNFLINSDIVSNLGSGFVHLSSNFGEEDYKICQNITPFIKNNNLLFNHINKKIIKNNKHKIKTNDYVNNDNMINNFFIQEINNTIFNIKKLNEFVFTNFNNNILFNINYSHIQPICWRCKNYLIVKNSEQWFINIKKIKKILKIIFNKKLYFLNKNNKNLFYNEQLKYFNTLKETINQRESWCISRQRPWGTPLPTFICINCNYLFTNKKCFDFIINIKKYQQLNELFLHSFRYYKKNKTIAKKYTIYCNKCNNKTLFYGDTIDIWFDSGIAWFFFNKIFKKQNALLYIEGYDQFRGWFQSSLLTYIAFYYNKIKLTNNFPYKYILCHGYIINDKYEKLSKSKNNYDNKTIKKYNSEIIRLFILSSKYTSEIKYSTKKIENNSVLYNKIKRFLEKIKLLINKHKNKNILNQKNIILLKNNILFPTIKNQQYSNFIKFFYIYFFNKFINYYKELKTFKFIHFLNIFIKKNNIFLKKYDFFIKKKIGYIYLINILNLLTNFLKPIIPNTIKNLNKNNNIYKNKNFISILKKNIKKIKNINKITNIIQNNEIINLIKEQQQKHNNNFILLQFNKNNKKTLFKLILKNAILNNNKILEIKKNNLLKIIDIINIISISKNKIIIRKFKNILKKNSSNFCFYINNCIIILILEKNFNNETYKKLIDNINKFIHKQRQYVKTQNKILIKTIIIKN
jgi:isoleucyl-tRNA synthetase